MFELRGQHFVGKVAQKALIMKGGKILLVRDPRNDDIIWELPGGRLDAGEEPQTGLAREILEELGVEVLVHEVFHLEQFFQISEGKQALMIAYRVTLKDENKPLLLNKEEIAEAVFVPIEEALTLNLYPEYKRTIEIYLAKGK